MAEEKKTDMYGNLMDVGRVFLEQAVSAQRSVLESYRQFTEGESATRSLRERHEELLNKTLEHLSPFFVNEQSMRQQVLKAQASLLELADETLRGFTRLGTARGGSRNN